MAATPTILAAAPPADAPPGELFSGYNPAGSLDGLFAPAFLKGLPASEKAVAQWTQDHQGLTQNDIDKTRMPNEWQPPSPMSAGDGVYGGPLPLRQNYGDPRGQADPMALRAMSQGLAYDMGARRDAIAQRLMSNDQLRSAYEMSQKQSTDSPILGEPSALMPFAR